MNFKKSNLEDVYEALTKLRQETPIRRKYPQDLWDAIIRLTQIHPIEKICLRLNISSAYLKAKIYQSEKLLPLEQNSLPVDFQEISHHIQSVCSDVIVIELSSNSGLRARIQGPLSSLSCLHSLFRG